MPPTMPYVYPIVKTEKLEFTVRPPTHGGCIFPSAYATWNEVAFAVVGFGQFLKHALARRS